MHIGFLKRLISTTQHLKMNVDITFRRREVKVVRVGGIEPTVKYAFKKLGHFTSSKCHTPCSSNEGYDS